MDARTVVLIFWLLALAGNVAAIIYWLRLRTFSVYIRPKLLEGGKLPDNSRVTWETSVGRKCKRCGKGSIVRVHRRYVFNKDNRQGLGPLTGLYRCNICDYRGLSLEKFD